MREAQIKTITPEYDYNSLTKVKFSSIVATKYNNKHLLIISSPSETNSNIQSSRGILELPGAAYDYSFRGFQAGVIRVFDIGDFKTGSTNASASLIVKGSQSSAHLGWKGGLAVGQNLLYVGESLFGHGACNLFFFCLFTFHH